MLNSTYINPITRVIGSIVFSVVLCSTVAAQPIKISGAPPGTPSGVAADQFQVSPDAGYAVFIADKDESLQLNELYKTRLSTGAVEKISGAFAPSGTINSSYGARSFKISHDSKYVVFWGRFADDLDLSNTELQIYSIALAGGARTLLATLQYSFGVEPSLNLEITPDSTRVIFVDRDGRLISVLIIGGASATLSGSVVDVPDFKISPNSQHVAFRGNSNRALFTAPINGGPVFTVYSGSNTVQTNSYEIAPNSATIAYSARGLARSMPITGGVATSLMPVPSLGYVYVVAISPDSARVVLQGELVTLNVGEVFSVSINGGDAINLSGTVLTTNNTFYPATTMSPDGTHVVFQSNLEGSAWRLYSAPLMGGARVTLATSAATGLLIDRIAISPDSRYVVLRGRLSITNTSENTDLHSVPITGGALTRLVGTPATSAGQIPRFEISADSSTVIYQNNYDGDGLTLTSVPITGGTRTNITNAASAPFVGIGAFKLSPDGSRVFFSAGNDVNPSIADLYRIQIGGAALALDIDGDDRVMPHSDLLLISRYLRGLRDRPLTTNAVGINATREDPAEIENYIRALLAYDAAL